MRIIFAISFIALFLYQILGIQLIYSIKQDLIRKEIKKQIKEGVDSKDLHRINYSELNKKDFVWVKKKEFRYKGKLYDVVFKHVQSDGSVLFECIDDTQETLLFASLDDFVDNNMQSKGLMKILKSGFEINSVQPVSDKINIPSDKNLTQNKTIYFFSTYVVNLSIDSPPPQII